jgi:Zn-dependent alcohol dehydrogenase
MRPQPSQLEASRKTRVAILWERGGAWSVQDIEFDPAKAGEVLVQLGGSGLCHSDEHVLTGDLPWPLPMIGGREGAGTGSIALATRGRVDAACCRR